MLTSHRSRGGCSTYGGVEMDVIRRRQQGGEHGRYGDSIDQRVPEPAGQIDPVSIAPTVLEPLQISGVNQLRDQGGGRPFGDADGERDIAEAQRWIARQANQDMPVMREKCPWPPRNFLHGNKLYGR